MAIGQRIKFFRNRKGMTQKQLGELLGFKGKTSDAVSYTHLPTLYA